MKKIILLFILFTGTLYAQPPIAQPDDMVVCDQDGDGVEIFDLTFTLSQLYNGLDPSLYTESFYTSIQDAQNEVNPIPNPSAYINSSNPETIYVRVFENADSTNFAITDFDLVIGDELEFSIVTWLTTVCESASLQGWFFNVSGTPNATVFYTIDGGDLQSFVLDENGIYNHNVGYVFNENEYVYFSFIEIVSNTFPFCSKSLSTLGGYTDIMIIPQPELIQPANLTVSENPFDGIATFDLTLIEDNLISDENIYPIQTINYYYENQLIENPTAYENLFNNQTIRVVVASDTGCVAEVTFDLIVLEDDIIFIPDANFKAKLLEASPFIQIALNAAGESITVDINNDGEIQLSEAIQIHTLYLGFSFISSLEGISYFTNLRRLDVYNSQLSALDLTQNINLEFLYCQENQLTNLNISGLSNLIEVDCSSNQISVLDIQDSSMLKVLMCQYNLIEELNTTNLFELEYLDCRLNQITNLDVSNSNTLIYLDCGNNQLSNLNIAGLENLVSASCSGNLLTNLDLSLCNSLSFLSCTHNQLTVLDLSDLTNLNFLSCSENQLVELDVSMCTNITTLGCYDNSIEYLNLKNGNNSLTSYFFNGNPSIYVCANESQVSALQNYMNSNNIIGHVNSFCSFTPGGDYNTITGNVHYDSNNNGCEATDYSIPFFRLAVDLNAVSTNSSVFSNNNGVYNLYTSTEGVYTLTPVLENPSYFTVSPEPGLGIIEEIDNTTTTLDFCIAANGVHPDLEIVVAPVVPARPGFEAKYLIVYKNKGNQILSQEYGVNFFYNQNLMQLVSASVAPSSQGPGGIQWDYANLMPFESRSIEVIMSINPPTDPENPVNIDDELTFTAVILPQAGDEIVQDNTFVYNQTVVGSYDPNDITCLQGDVVPPSEIGNYLHYIIRFENTGTAPAENIVVKVEVDPMQFDSNSLQMLSASHQANIRMTGNKIEFIFQNIQLDSGGHGNILLKMRSNEVLEVGDMVEKKANIYFDYNFPIETNRAETLFQALSVVNPILDNIISIYPNPVKDIVNITIKDNSTIKTIELYDIQGRLLQTQLVNNITSELNLSSRANGMYFIKINTDLGSKVEKLIKE